MLNDPDSYQDDNHSDIDKKVSDYLKDEAKSNSFTKRIMWLVAFNLIFFIGIGLIQVLTKFNFFVYFILSNVLTLIVLFLLKIKPKSK